MMPLIRVKFLRGTSLGNGSDAHPGDVMLIDARLLPIFQQQGRVDLLTDEAPAAPAAPVPAPAEEMKPTRRGKRNA